MSLDILLAFVAKEREPGMQNQVIHDQVIKDAYISVELQAQALDAFKESLRRSLSFQGFECEDASASAHVSIAYAQGEVGVDTVHNVACEIARDPFQLNVTGIEILEGKTTPYDYLVLTVESRGCFQKAVDVVCQTLPTRGFSEGFKSHVSLLRFKKGTLTKAEAEALAQGLGEQGRIGFLNCFCLEGVCVCVYNPNREKCVQVGFIGAGGGAAAAWAA